jgi:hypothetical protein
MNANAFSQLETALLAEFRSLYESVGFPPPESLSMAGRQNTPCGRYVTLRCAAPCSMTDGYLDLGGKIIEMNGISHGMMAVVLIKDGYPKEMEIVAYGGEAWDGSEINWSIQ